MLLKNVQNYTILFFEIQFGVWSNVSAATLWNNLKKKLMKPSKKTKAIDASNSERTEGSRSENAELT